VELLGNRIEYTKYPVDRTIGICMEEHTSEIQLDNNEFVNCGLETHSHWFPEGME